MDEVLKSAKNCRHYAMCKIDFLGNGVCPSGLQNKYVSYYPQGRMDLYAALAEGKVPVTQRALDIADGCDLCGRCDPQCYFTTELRPTPVMRALKDLIKDHRQKNGPIETTPEDDILRVLRGIVGDEWATNDRAVALTYSHDPSPLGSLLMPAYVVLPRTAQEVSEILKTLNQRGIPWVPRGNGASIIGIVMTEGAVIDLNRMNTIEFDEKNWSVKVGAGVTSFELQKAAVQRGYRVQTSEPMALVCANIVFSGTMSLFSSSYGVGADTYVDAEFVSPEGRVFSLNDKDAPNLFSYRYSQQPTPGICTSAKVKLNPITSDEEAVLVPFETLEKAVAFSKECAARRIGLANGILGGGYISDFLSPTKRQAVQTRKVFEEKLGIKYLVLIIGDAYALRSIREMGHPVIDQKLFRTLYLGLPALTSAKWLDILDGFSQGEPFSYLESKGFAELAETALHPDPSTLLRDVDPELRPFYEEVYKRPEMTNLVWLNMFRILSTRMGRAKHFINLNVYLPMEADLIEYFCGEFKAIADRHGITNDMGFITPIDGGKRCVLECDYFLDPHDPVEIDAIRLAFKEAGDMVMARSEKEGTIRWFPCIPNQGCSRTENLLYI